LNSFARSVSAGVLNPYPVPINHTDDGSMWINWAGTQAARPVRIYSDGAVWARKECVLLWAADEKNRSKLTRADQVSLEEKHRKQMEVLEAVAHPSPRSVEDLKAIVAYAKQEGLRVRVYGCNHSFAPICGTNELLVDGRCINTLPRVTGAGSDDEPELQTACGSSSVSKYALWERYHMSVNPNDPLAAGFTSSATATFSPGISTGDFERWIETVHNEGAPRGYKMPTSTVEDVFTVSNRHSLTCTDSARAEKTTK
jgi:hypothetical protein